jgi:tRNA nucleotidyltransferase/poly(A) polymerase
LTELARAVEAEGGRLYAVGGWVRDQLLGVESKDIDCEVHGLEIHQVEALLQARGEVNYVGKAFGVFKLSTPEGLFDIALPRVDLGVSAAKPEPHLGLHKASLRRDLRCNALLFDPLTEEVIDTVDGRADIEARRLRVVDPSRFGEDPLRALRAARFCATLGFEPDEELVSVCRKMDLSTQPVERIWPELMRMLLSDNPGRGLRALLAYRQLEAVLPELEEGNLPALAEALERAVAPRNALERKEGGLCVMIAVLLAHMPETRRNAFFSRLKIERPGGIAIRRIALRLLLELPLEAPPSDSRLRHLAEICRLSWALAVAAALTPQLDSAASLKRGVALGLSDGPLPSLLGGRDLGAAGIPQGPEMGVMMRAARKAQLDGVFSTRPEALTWLRAHFASESKLR